MHSLLHNIPQFLILFLEELFVIFTQMLKIWSFGRRVCVMRKNDFSPFLSFQVMPFLLIFQVS